jgi:hypothetical protein
MHYLVSVLLVAFLPFATGEQCKTHGGQCDQICVGDTVPGKVNDCPGVQYCCVKKTSAGRHPTADVCTKCIDNCKGDPECEADCAPQCLGSKEGSPPAEVKTPSGTEAPAGTPASAPTEETAQKEHFSEKILVCSPLGRKYVSSNRGILVCNSDHTSLHLLYKDGFRLIQIVNDGKRAIYYLERK